MRAETEKRDVDSTMAARVAALDALLGAPGFDMEKLALGDMPASAPCPSEVFETCRARAAALASRAWERREAYVAPMNMLGLPASAPYSALAAGWKIADKGLVLDSIMFIPDKMDRALCKVFFNLMETRGFVEECARDAKSLDHARDGGWTKLAESAVMGDLCSVALLLVCGADPRASGAVGEKTPVEHALRACDKACRCFSIGCRHESVITMLNAKAAEAGAGAPRQ